MWCLSQLFMGMLQAPIPLFSFCEKSVTFLFLAIKELELGGLTVSYLLTQN